MSAGQRKQHAPWHLVSILANGFSAAGCRTIIQMDDQQEQHKQLHHFEELVQTAAVSVTSVRHAERNRTVL